MALVDHIRRYWSIDGKPLGSPTLITYGNSDALRESADCLKSVELSRTKKYPGVIIEWQLRNLAGQLQQFRFLSLQKIKTASPYEREAIGGLGVVLIDFLHELSNGVNLRDEEISFD